MESQLRRTHEEMRKTSDGYLLRQNLVIKKLATAKIRKLLESPMIADSAQTRLMLIPEPAIII